MSLIRVHDCPSQPWKNGLGSTRELAVYPSHASAGEFIWRVSIATVDSAAPFSFFPGIDRQIALLRGAGFRMTLDGQREHALDTPFVPFAFPGEARVTTALIDGPTEDFNLMMRRDQARGALEVWTEARRYEPDVRDVLIYCAAGSMEIAGTILQAGDAWRATPGASAQPMLHVGAVALAVRVLLG
jgi:environmental stress-induced protein Ves